MENLENRIHYNNIQLKANIVRAKLTNVRASRATGKTEGIMAPYLSRCMDNMPRSSGSFLAESFGKIYGLIIPKIEKSWNQLGYERDIHYFIGKKPPQKWINKYNWKLPYLRPSDFKNYITWYTGAGLYIDSQNANASSFNGGEIDFLGIDETKKFNGKKIKEEIFPALRGRSDKFGHIPEHHSIMMCCDKVIGTGDNPWYFEYEKKHTEDIVNAIIQLQFEQNELIKNNASITKINKLEKQLLLLRKNCIYDLEGSTIENIHSLTAEFFLSQIDILGPELFRVAIFNENQKNIKGGFYTGIDCNIHGYDAYDTDLIHNLDYNYEKANNSGCLKDKDIDHTKALEISFDYGANCNSLVVTQADEYEFRLLKDFFCESPRKHSWLAKEFVEYYKHFGKGVNKKIVYLYGDPSGDRDMQGKETGTTMAQDVINILTSAGWDVMHESIKYKKYPDHFLKYNIWQNVLKEDIGRDNRMPRFRYNKDNAERTYEAMTLTKTKKNNMNEFEKDKSKERDEKYPQVLAPHLTDALDYILCNKIIKYILDPSYWG